MIRFVRVLTVFLYVYAAVAAVTTVWHMFTFNWQAATFALGALSIAIVVIVRDLRQKLRADRYSSALRRAMTSGRI